MYRELSIGPEFSRKLLTNNRGGRDGAGGGEMVKRKSMTYAAPGRWFRGALGWGEGTDERR